MYASVNQFTSKKVKMFSKHPQFEMAGIALKDQCDFASIIFPPEVSLKEKCL